MTILQGASASVANAMATQTAAAPRRTRRRTPPAISGDQLGELIGLIKTSDSVELKLTVPEENHRSTIRSLGMDPLEAQIRQVVFFDTPDLDLDKAGVVVRARRIQGSKPDDCVVKLRPVVPEHLSGRLRKSGAFRVEVDALPGGFVCSATLKGMCRPGEVKAVLGGERAIRKLYSKEQRAFYAKHAPDDIELDDLSILGPIFVLKLRFFPRELRRKMVAEMWLYPDGSRILELSTRCTTGEAFQAAAELRAYLAAQGVEVSGEQQTKTRKALTYFANHLD
jgi:hypothetical protein